MPASTSIVIFGASGDLSHRKLIPALYHLYLKGRMPERFRIFGTAGRNWTDEDLRNTAREQLQQLSNKPLNEEKWRRFRAVETLQEQIATELHAALEGKILPVLFEEKQKGRWMGRTEHMDLVYVESESDLTGLILPVKINWTGPWTMIGELV